MAKAYVGDIGTAIEINTFIDLTLATTKEFKVKKPDGTIHTWDVDIPDGLTAADGRIVHFTVEDDFDQAGKYYIQPHVITGSSDHLGDTESFEVFDAFQ
jgi:hypothetical protein